MAGESGEKGVFPPFDFETLPSQLLWLTVTFGIFYFLMSRLVLPRIGSILETRSDRIAQDIDEANRLQRESEDAHAAYERELSEAKTRAFSIAQSAKDMAKRQLESKRAQLDERFASELSDSEAQLSKARTDALSNLSLIAEPTVHLILSEVFDQRVDSSEISKTISSIKH